MKKYQYLKLLPFFFIMPVTNSVYGQLKYHYVKGSIELLNGQTISGFIKDDEIAKMNNKISFKASEADKSIVTYDTSQIKSFKLDDGETFELLRFRGHGMEYDVSVLAKLIVKGKASLYKIIYNSDERYIITNGEKTYVLQNDKLEGGTMSTVITKSYFKYYLSKAVDDITILKEKIEKTSFNERDFRTIISAYNKSLGVETIILPEKKKTFHFIIASAGGMIKSSDENEFYIQAIYRTYFPKVSRSTSINIGVNYFQYQFSEINVNYPYNKINYTSNLISLPVQMQQNILNKNIRPYFFAGFNASYFKAVDEKGNSQIQKGFQKSFGIGLLYGAGIEADIYKGLMIKSEFRQENYTHLILLGIGYIFSKH